VAAGRLIRRVVVAAGLALSLSAAAASATHPTITPARSGATFRFAKGDTAELRLPEPWDWTEPRVSSHAVALTPVLFFVDPGYREWVVTARARGTATIRSVGRPACSGCGLATRNLRVTIVVR
jgi:hypothetical protein